MNIRQEITDAVVKEIVGPGLAGFKKSVESQ